MKDAATISSADAIGSDVSGLPACTLTLSLFVAVLTLGFQPAESLAQHVNPDFWVTNGPVHATTISANVLYVGGEFSYVGPYTGGGVPLQSPEGSNGFPKVHGTVHAVASDGRGGWFIGGAFDSVGGEPRANLAHIEYGSFGSGRFFYRATSWAPNADGEVNAIVVDGDATVYVGGGFTVIDRQRRNQIAAVNYNDGVVTDWDPNAGNATVYALAQSGPTIYAGGAFTSIGGQPRNFLAAIRTTDGQPTNWNPRPTSEVRCLALSDNTLFVGGFFGFIGNPTPVRRNYLAAVNAINGSVIDWDPDPDNEVYDLTTSATKLYAGGKFTRIQGQPRGHVAGFYTNDGIGLLTWNPNANGDVYALGLTNTTVYAGGQFTSIGGQPRSRIAEIQLSGIGLATSFDPSASGTVEAVGVNSGSVYAGGSFVSIGGVTRNNIAALDLSSGSATGWNPDANGRVNALDFDSGFVFVGGDFTSIGGQARNRIASLDLAGVATPWNPDAFGGSVRALKVDVGGATVYVGGDFTNVADVPRNRIASLDLAGGATDWNPDANGSVTVLEVGGATVYAAGSFSAIGGFSRNSVAALDRGTGAATLWNPNSNGQVFALAKVETTIYMAGNFTLVGGRDVRRLAAIDSTSGQARNWFPNPNGSVSSLLVDGRTVYAGGSFSFIGDQSRRFIAALDDLTGLATDWNPAGGVATRPGRLQGGPDPSIRSLSFANGTVFAGGLFDDIGGVPSPNIAAISAPPGCPQISILPAILPNGTVGVTYGHDLTGVGGAFPYTFRDTLGALPAGLTLSSGGFLSGTPTSVGTSSFLVVVSDENGCPGQQAFSLTIGCPTISVDPLELPIGIVGVAYSDTIKASGGIGPYTFRDTLGVLPPGLTLSSNGFLSGTPTVEGQSEFSIKATDANGCVGLRGYTVVVECPAIRMSPTELDNATVGSFFSQTFTASGGTAPYAFRDTLGGLPPGLALDTTGVVSGIPTVSGSRNFTLKATDANGCFAIRTYTLGVSCPAITMDPPTLPSGTIGAVYSQAVTATPAGGGGSYSYRDTLGALPAGITLSSGGLLSGTPTTVGTSSFMILALGASSCAGAQTFSLTVGCPVITLSPATLPNGVIGIDYGVAIAASGGTAPYDFRDTLGTLPPGLTMSANGVLSGAPTVVETSSFSVRVTDALGCIGLQTYSLSITCPTVTLSPDALPDGAGGRAYGVNISASGGKAPYFFRDTLGTLPDGLTLFPDGILLGAPTTVGTSNFSVRAVDSNGCLGLRAYSVTIGCQVITVNPAALPNGTVGAAYSQTVTARVPGSGGPYSFRDTLGTLPSGLTLGETGVLSGTPLAVGTANFSVRAVDSNGCLGLRVYSLTIGCPTITLGPPSLPAGQVGTPYIHSFSVVGGTGPFTFAVLSGTLPANLFLGSNGSLSGTPTSPGTSIFTVQVTDSQGCTGSLPITLVICPAITVGPLSLANGKTGIGYLQTIVAAGGAEPFTFGVSGGTLPAGLSLTSGGVLSGTPTIAGPSSFIVTAIDTQGCSGSRAYVVSVTGILVSTLGTPHYVGFAIPFVGSGALDIRSLGLGAPDTTQWRLGHYLPLDDTFESADQGLTQLDPGQGYWLVTRAPVTIEVVDVAAPPDSLVIPLIPAAANDSLWYQLGNPYEVPLPIASILVRAGGGPQIPLVASGGPVLPQVFVFDDDDFHLVTGIESHAAFWVLLTPGQADVVLTLRRPFTNMPDVLSSRAENSNPATAWSLTLTARQGASRCLPITVGAVAAGLDRFAIPLPPDPPGRRLRLAVGAAGGRQQRYMTALGPAVAAMSWDLTLSSAEAPGIIAIDVAPSALPAGARVRIVDPEKQSTWDVVPGTPLTLAATGNPRRLRLEVTLDSHPSVAPLVDRAIVYPNPSAGSTGLWLTHSKPQDLAVTLYDLAGRNVWHQERSAAPPGEHVFSWGGSSTQGTRLPAGVYLARYRIGPLRGTLRIIRL